MARRMSVSLLVRSVALCAALLAAPVAEAQVAAPAGGAARSAHRMGASDEAWFATVKEDGARHGLEALAQRVFRTGSGRYYVPDDEERGRILALRRDPRVQTQLAADYQARALALIKERLGRGLAEHEWPIAALLGPTDAAALIRLAEVAPAQRAAAELPAAAKTHPQFFSDRTRDRSALEVYRAITGGQREPATAALRPAQPSQAPTAVSAWSTTVARAATESTGNTRPPVMRLGQTRSAGMAPLSQ